MDEFFQFYSLLFSVEKKRVADTNARGSLSIKPGTVLSLSLSSQRNLRRCYLRSQPHGTIIISDPRATAYIIINILTWSGRSYVCNTFTFEFPLGLVWVHTCP